MIYLNANNKYERPNLSPVLFHPTVLDPDV